MEQVYYKPVTELSLLLHHKPNTLPTELKLLQSTDSFRCQLKRYYYLSLFMDTRMWTDSVMDLWSSNASVTVNLTICHSCHITKSVLAMKGTQCTNSNTENH